MPAHNKRFGARRGVRPQKVLSEFESFAPARTFVKPRPVAKRPLVIAQCKTHRTNGTFGFSNTHSQHKTKRAIFSNTLQYNSKKIINFDHNWTSTNSGNDTRAKNKRIKATSWS